MQPVFTISSRTAQAEAPEASALARSLGLATGTRTAWHFRSAHVGVLAARAATLRRYTCTEGSGAPHPVYFEQSTESLMTASLAILP
jgi:hypothetical protein